MLQAKLSSPNRLKGNLSKSSFEGGTSLLWNVFKPRLFAELNTKQAFEYVGVTVPGALDALGNPVEKIPDFHRPCAVGNEEVHIQALLDAQALAVQNTLAANTAIINAIPNNQLNVGAKAIEIMKAQVKTNDDLTRIANTRGSVTKDLEASIALYEKRLENFQQRKADAIKVLYSMLGSGPLSIAETFLRDGRPRAAFVALDTHFNAGLGGQQAASSIMNQMQRFDVDLSLGSLSEHMNALRAMSIEWEAGGLNQPLSPTFLLLTFLAAVERSTATFKDEIQHIRQNSLSWDAAMLKLQEREAAMSVEKCLSPKKKGYRGLGQDVPKDEIHSLLTKLVKKHVGKTRSRETAAATAAAVKESPKKKALPTCGKCKKRGHSSEQCWVDLTCPQCNKKGHIPKFCPEVTGKPLGGTKKPVHAFNSVTELSNGDVATNSSTLFFCDLCGEHAECNGVLEDDQGNERSRDLSIRIMRENLLIVLMQELALGNRYELDAGERKCHRSLRFIVDSGASGHMFPCKNLFKDLACTVQGSVSLGKADYKLRIVGQGKTAIDALESVLWVPGLSFGLISVTRFDNKGYRTVMELGKVVVTNEVGEVVLSGTLEGNLYYLDEEYLTELWGSSRCSCSRHNVTVALEEGEVMEEVLSPGVQAMHEAHVTKDACDSFDLLHRRIGHAGEGVLKRALKNENFADSSISYDDVKNCRLRFCTSCHEGKMKAFASPNTSSGQQYDLFEKICIDYKGKFSTISEKGNSGFYLITDAGSGNNFSFPCSDKSSETLVDILEEFSAIVKHASKKMKVLQSDFDSVLRGDLVQEWLKDNGIKHQMSAPHVHWQNGMVESNIGKIMDKTRTIMAHGRVPWKYWDFAVETACYLSNRTPVGHSNTTPYELLFGRKPSISHLIQFYSPGVYHKTKAERKGSLDYKAVRCRMLGYDDKLKDSYRVLIVESGTILSRHDCIWNEESLESISTSNLEGQLDPFDFAYENGFSDSLGKTIRRTQPVLDSELPSVDESGVTKDVGENDTPTEDHPSSPKESRFYDEESEENLYWKEESANLLERWLEDVSVLADARAWAVESAAKLNAEPLPPTPRSVEEALNGPDKEKWREALLKELRSFDERKVFAEAPQEGRAMKTKLILRTQYKNDYSIKYKVRLVACGYSQIYGVDYQETYAPTASTTVVLLVIQLAAMRGLLFSEFDVTAAFLEGKNDFPNFARLPKIIGNGRRVEVVGNFYGEKQGPKIWNDQLNEILIKAGFIRCPAHPCLYKKSRDEAHSMWIVVHVDDGLITTDCKKTRDEFMRYFQTQVKEATHLDTVGRYVGMDFDFFPEQRKVLLSHKLYISSKWGEFVGNERIPMCSTTNLRKAVANPQNPSMLHDTGEFRFMCDRGRPDMLVVTGELATGGDKDPSDEHLKVAKKAKNYLKSTMLLGLSLGGLGILHIFGYSDASWVTDGNCKCCLGGCVFLNADSGSIRSFSKNDTKPSSLSHSSCEAEIKAMDEWVREVIHIIDMFAFLCGPYNEPVQLFVDSLSAIDLCKTLRQSHKVKHINMRIHFIREMIEDGFMEVFFVPTEKNVADVLTKPL